MTIFGVNGNAVNHKMRTKVWPKYAFKTPKIHKSNVFVWYLTFVWYRNTTLANVEQEPLEISNMLITIYSCHMGIQLQDLAD